MKNITTVTDEILLQTLFDCAEEKKAEYPVGLDMRQLEGPAAYFFICSGLSSPQIRAISEAIHKGVLEKHGIRPTKSDGTRESGWMVLDFGSVMVHIFSKEKRELYTLEDLWRDADVIRNVPD